jgi:hypothetical protein
MSRTRVALFALVLTLAACGGDDGSGGVGPQTNTCSGTCLVVSNQSAALTITEVFYSACTDPGWGVDRLSGSQVLRPGSSRGWQVTAGCWDIMAAREEPGERWESISYGVTLAAGESYTLVFDF